MPHRFTTPYEVALKYKALKKTLEKEEDIQSRTIRFLRFPLIVAVVLIHTRLDHVVVNGHLLTETARFPVFALCQHIVSTEIARIAVPLFYFMSGYLFFTAARHSAWRFMVRKSRSASTVCLSPTCSGMRPCFCCCFWRNNVCPN